MLSPGLPAWLAGTWNIHPDIKIWAICVCCSAHLLLNCLILFNVWYFQRNIATFIMLIHVIRFHHSVEILFKLKLQFLIRSFYQKGSLTCSASSLMYSSFFLADSILKMKKCLVYDFDIWTSPSYFLPKIKIHRFIYIDTIIEETKSHPDNMQLSSIENCVPELVGCNLIHLILWKLYISLINRFIRAVSSELKVNF